MFDFLDIVDIEAAFEMIYFDAYNEKRSFLACFFVWFNVCLLFVNA